ncbi:uncharacterized protein LOC129786814 [Lutzomyia longipalpis]|uniref:uncharacterized protein LOC129786814 n=1 Tax=Lutzomyia longipalpis TaxID=7200 RepID=UPI00248402DC|nr:uncharacterized protein LOC129786814 [Lutzomyia longipalpis]
MDKRKGKKSPVKGRSRSERKKSVPAKYQDTQEKKKTAKPTASQSVKELKLMMQKTSTAEHEAGKIAHSGASNFDPEYQYAASSQTLEIENKMALRKLAHELSTPMGPRTPAMVTLPNTSSVDPGYITNQDYQSLIDNRTSRFHEGNNQLTAYSQYGSTRPIQNIDHTRNVLQPGTVTPVVIPNYQTSLFHEGNNQLTAYSQYVSTQPKQIDHTRNLSQPDTETPDRDSEPSSEFLGANSISKSELPFVGGTEVLFGDQSLRLGLR